MRTAIIAVLASVLMLGCRSTDRQNITPTATVGDPYGFLLGKLADGNVVMLGEAHNNYCLLRNTAALLERWYERSAADSASPKNLVLVLEPSVTFGERLNAFLKGATPDTLFYHPTTYWDFSTALFEFMHDLRSLYRRVRSDSVSGRQFRVVCIEPDPPQFRSRKDLKAYFRGPRDSLSARQCIDTMAAMPGFAFLCVYGEYHIQKKRPEGRDTPVLAGQLLRAGVPVYCVQRGNPVRFGPGHAIPQGRRSIMREMTDGPGEGQTDDPERYDARWVIDCMPLAELPAGIVPSVAVMRARLRDARRLPERAYGTLARHWFVLTGTAPPKGADLAWMAQHLDSVDAVPDIVNGAYVLRRWRMLSGGGFSERAVDSEMSALTGVRIEGRRASGLPVRVMWDEVISRRDLELKIRLLIGMLFLGTERERVASLQALRHLTGEQFSEPGEWNRWYHAAAAAGALSAPKSTQPKYRREMRRREHTGRMSE